MKKISTFFSVFIAVFLLGISVEISFLSAAEDVYQQKCAKCHSLRNPDNYTKDEWKYNVERMSGRAGLTAQETQSITDLNKKK